MCGNMKQLTDIQKAGMCSYCNFMEHVSFKVTINFMKHQVRSQNGNYITSCVPFCLDLLTEVKLMKELLLKQKYEILTPIRFPGNE